MKRIKAGNVLACEYAALGSHGKHTLVNVYTGADIVVPHYPALIPLAFYIEIFPDPSMGKEMQVRIYENKKLRVTMTAEFQFEKDRIGLAVLPQMAWGITKETDVRLVMQCEGFMPTTLLRKKIRLGEVPVG